VLGARRGGAWVAALTLAGQCLLAGESDSIIVRGGRGATNALALMDAPGEPCVNDQAIWPKGRGDVGDIRNVPGCRGEILVLAPDRRMAMLEDPAWTVGRDVSRVVLKRRIRVPLNVWLGRRNAAIHARNSIAVADEVFNRSRVGVELSRSIRTRALPSIELVRDGCEGAPFTNAAYVKGELNVYFVSDDVIKQNGLNCRNDRNVIFIGRHEMDDILAHELGHAFGLNNDGCREFRGDGRCSEAYSGHPNDLPNFDSFGVENVMSLGNSGTLSFTPGQAIRMNLHSGSMLNVNGHRKGPTRDCPGDLANEECPALDWPGEALE